MVLLKLQVIKNCPDSRFQAKTVEIHTGQDRNPESTFDVGFHSICCEYHWLTNELLWAYSKAIGEQS